MRLSMSSYHWMNQVSGTAVISSFLKSAQEMQASAHRFMQKEHVVFQARKAESSDSKKVAAKVSNSLTSRLAARRRRYRLWQPSKGCFSH